MGDCTDSHVYGYVAIPVVFFLSLSGSLLPALLQRFKPKWDILHNPFFRFCQGLAGGFVVSVAFVHSFFESVLSIEESGLLPEYAWAGMFALVGLLVTWSVEVWIAVILFHQRKAELSKEQSVPHNHQQAPHGHNHRGLQQHLSMSEFPLSSDARVAAAIKASNAAEQHSRDHNHSLDDPECKPVTQPACHDDDEENPNASESDSSSHSEHEHAGCVVDNISLLLQHEQRVKNYSALFILLFGLTFHSIFVGFAIGLANERALFIAVLAHQFFEALALGFHIVKAQLRSLWVVCVLVLVFSASAPVGTGIGIGIASSICDDPATYTLVEGIFNSLAAGILLYVGCVHMIAENFSKPDVIENWKVAMLCWLGVILGAVLMAILGIWA